MKDVQVQKVGETKYISVEVDPKEKLLEGNIHRMITNGTSFNMMIMLGKPRIEAELL